MTELTPINLKEKYGHLYRIRDDGTDDSDRKQRVWCQEIWGPTAVIYPYGGDELCVSTTGRLLRGKLKRLGFPIEQWGDTEGTFRFPESRIHEIAALIGARKRRQLTPEQRRASAAHLASYRFKKGSR